MLLIVTSFPVVFLLSLNPTIPGTVFLVRLGMSSFTAWHEVSNTSLQLLFKISRIGYITAVVPNRGALKKSMGAAKIPITDQGCFEPKKGWETHHFLLLYYL